MKYIQSIIVSVVLFTSCNYLDVEPVGKVIPDEVSEFRALMTQAYSIYPKYKRYLTVRSDEVFPYVYGLSYDNYIDMATWKDESDDPLTYDYPWEEMYRIIFYANSTIDGIMDAKVDVTDDSREQLLAEAYCLRAYTHFELLNLYAKQYVKETASSDKGVPVVLVVDIDQAFPRATVEEVYTQILKDIEEAGKYMQIDEQPASTRYRFSKKSLKSLEARVRLYRGEWELAQAVAEDILPQCTLIDMVADNEAKPWRYDSQEAILSLEQVSNVDIVDDMTMLWDVAGKYSMEQENDIYLDTRVNRYFRVSYSGYIPNKGMELGDKVTFRSSEIYLIAAEAAARQTGKLDVAKGYLLSLMKNRLIADYYSQKEAEIEGMDQEQLINEIMDERARELVFEGHRWYDLRRTTRPKIVKTYYNEEFEEFTATLYADDPRYTIPFPKEAIENNPNLID